MFAPCSALNRSINIIREHSLLRVSVKEANVFESLSFVRLLTYNGTPVWDGWLYKDSVIQTVGLFDTFT